MITAMWVVLGFVLEACFVLGFQWVCEEWLDREGETFYEKDDYLGSSPNDNQGRGKR